VTRANPSKDGDAKLPGLLTHDTLIVAASGAAIADLGAAQPFVLQRNRIKAIDVHP
jgi:hypothetical protein